MTITYPYAGPVAHSSGTGNLPVIRIVVHCTAGADAKGATGTATYFRMQEATGSAHAIADNDQTLTCAYDNVVCWHAPPNPHSLGIEMCCSLSNDGQGHWTLSNHVAMMKRTAKWVAEKCVKHDIPVRKLTVAQVRAGYRGICGHWDVTQAFGQSTHTDPERYFPWSTFMGYVQDYYDAIVSPVPAPQPEEDPLSGITLDQIAATVYTQNAKYGANLWAAPTGTGTALIETVNGIAQAVGILSNKLDAVQKQISDEDIKDDADLAAATAQINKGLSSLQTAVDLMQQEVKDLETTPVTLPKA